MKSILDCFGSAKGHRATQMFDLPREGSGPLGSDSGHQIDKSPTVNSHQDECFDRVLARLLSDQEEATHPYHGQFGRNRDLRTRRATQADSEPLEEKPELFMTFTASLNLRFLAEVLERKTTPAGIRSIIARRLSELTDANRHAGLFAERLILNAREQTGRPLIMMRECPAYEPDDLFVSYRHTIGAGIVLLLSGIQVSLQKALIEELLKDGVQNPDGGWPIADRVHTKSDILCSAHAAFYFRLAVGADICKTLNAELEERYARTVAYLTVEARNAEWTYGHALGTVPFTARTFPEFVALLGKDGSILVEKIPDRLLEQYPAPTLPHNHPFIRENRNKTGINNERQLIVRLAYALKVAANRNSEKYVERYILFRNEAISSYSDQGYYDTYDLCCLLAMLTDRFIVDGKSIAIDAMYISEPILHVMPFFGKAYGITREAYRRAKERGYLKSTEVR